MGTHLPAYCEPCKCRVTDLAYHRQHQCPHSSHLQHKVGSHGNQPLSEASGSAQSEAKESTSSNSVSPSPVEQAKEKVLNAADKLTSIWDVTKANGWTQIVEAIDELIAAVSADAHQEIEELDHWRRRFKAICGADTPDSAGNAVLDLERTSNELVVENRKQAEQITALTQRAEAAEARLSALQWQGIEKPIQHPSVSSDADPRDDDSGNS